MTVPSSGLSVSSFDFEYNRRKLTDNRNPCTSEAKNSKTLNLDENIECCAWHQHIMKPFKRRKGLLALMAKKLPLVADRNQSILLFGVENERRNLEY